MPKHMQLRAPQIARHLTGLWQDHTEALNQNALRHIDALMDAAVAAQPMEPWQLRNLLVDIVPKMQHGTARRLVQLKYPHASDGSIIKPRRIH